MKKLLIIALTLFLLAFLACTGTLIYLSLTGCNDHALYVFGWITGVFGVLGAIITVITYCELPHSQK